MNLDADRIRTLHEAATTRFGTEEERREAESRYMRALRNAVPDILELAAEVEALRAERDALRAENEALAEDLASAEAQWGDEYLWEKWDQSASLNARRARLAASTPDTESETG